MFIVNIILIRENVQWEHFISSNLEKTWESLLINFDESDKAGIKTTWNSFTNCTKIISALLITGW